MVAFTPGEGHGTADPAEAVSDKTGLAWTVWTLGGVVSEQALAAAVGDVSVSVVASTTNPDRAALEALYHAADGPNWINNENWLTDAALGEWYGVQTDASGRVVGLELAGGGDDEAGRNVRHGLSGPIPSDLGNLTKLLELDLGGNALTGLIPPELGNLHRLQHLDLQVNLLQGEIPADLGNLARLSMLSSSINQLAGQVPPELGDPPSLRSLTLGGNRLEGEIPSELGDLPGLETLSLQGNDLVGEIPPELGNLTTLQALLLNGNDLGGRIPPEFENLINLQSLYLRNNALTGPIPEGLVALSEIFRFSWRGNDGLCAQGTTGFVEWLKKMRDVEGLFCNETDVSALELLYHAAGGSGWTNADGWTAGAALGRWHGVTADSLGRVVELDLGRNGLTGRLPATLGHLDRMTSLRIGGNALSGPLPMALARLPLRELHYTDTELCTPIGAEFQAWLHAIPSHEGTGLECILSDRDVLGALYEATDGTTWNEDDNWLTDAPLGEWHGIEADETGEITGIDLRANHLQGRIPPELGQL